jgi:hypothetical protein
MCKYASIPNYAVTAVGEVSAHLSLVLGLIDVLAAVVAWLLVLHRRELLRVRIVINING